MTHRDPGPPEPSGPRRSPGFNSLVVLAIVLAFGITGVVVWASWSRDSSSAADDARGHPVQPSELPPANPDSLSPHGAHEAQDGANRP